MQLYGAHFKYNGVDSVSYGLIIANIDTEIQSSLISGSSTLTINNKRNNTLHYVGREYDDGMLSFDIEIVAAAPIPRELQGEIEEWLFYTDGYKKLYLNIDEDDLMYTSSYITVNGEIKQIYFNCILTAPEKLEYDNGVIGYKCTVECDAPHLWTDDITVTNTRPTSTSASGTWTFTVNLPSNVPGYIYPKVNFVTGTTGGTVSLTNTTDSSTRVTSFINLPVSTGFHMDGAINYIAPTAGTGSYYSNFYDRNFLRLKRGNNTISVSGDIASVTIIMKGRMYL